MPSVGILTKRMYCVVAHYLSKKHPQTSTSNMFHVTAGFVKTVAVPFQKKKKKERKNERKH